MDFAVPENLISRLANIKNILIRYAPLHSMLSENWSKPMKVHLSQRIIDNPDKAQDAWVKSFKAGCDIASTSTQASSP